MKQKLVLWGSNEKEERLFLAIELVEKENMVKIHAIPEEKATQELVEDLTNKWRDNIEVAMPDGIETIERPLSVSDSILPDHIKVTNTNLIQRAQTEWHFIVLSSKLYEIYKTELADISDKVEDLSEYSESMWNELKGYWDKVLEQVREKALFREHANTLKEKTNGLFDTLKALRKVRDKQFDQLSKEVKTKYMSSIQEIEEKIEKGLGFKPLFNDLRKLQNDLKGENITRSDRNTIWNKIDAAFKALKDGKYGGEGNEHSSPLSRLQNRYNGLLNAITKMEKSISRDENELDFQKNRMGRTGGQLEMQLREAKHAMVKERISSKKLKLEDMVKTKSMLESKMEKEKLREEERAKKQKVEEAKAEAKQKIASEIKEQQATVKEDLGDKLSDAAAAIADGKNTSTEETIIEKGENFVEDIKANVMAVAAVLKDKIEDAVDYVEDKVEDLISEEE